jgi:hypothetical protein
LVSKLTYPPGPAGQAYYYNSQTRESTYIRPLPSFTAPIPPVGQQKKKEKAHLKTPLPGTDWIRVTTTEGNTFYSNKITKQSLWTVPPEIADAVKALDQQEKAPEHAPRAEKGDTVKAKVAKEGKRKLDEVVAIDEVVSKKAKVEEEGDDEGSGEEDGSEDDDEEMEDWQREAAEQLAREAEEEAIRREEEAKQQEEEERKAKEEAEKAKNEGALPKLNMPERVDLSLDEAKALFKVRSGSFLRSAQRLIAPRPCYERRISTHCTLGISVFHYSSQIRDTFSYHLSPPGKKHLMNIVETVLGSCERTMSRKNDRKRIQRRSLINF